jgi:DNA-binding NtrC family response regulator
MLLSSQAETALTERLWPGNVRELKNALKRAVALARGTGLLQTIHFAPFGDPVTSDPPPPEPPLAFPPDVLARAQALWNGADPARPDDASKHEHRARERAALLCLKARTPISAWPKALSQQWHRLFGAKWATTEEGRGLRELVRELGLDPRDENVREGVRARVEKG